MTTVIATHVADRWGTLVRTEYRVRAASTEERSELARHPIGMPYGRTAYLLERRTSKRADGHVDYETSADWHAMGSGPTPEDAACTCYESAFVAAAPEHPLHRVAMERRARNLRRDTWLRRVRALAQGVALNAVRQEATEAFHAALKRARLYGAAMRNKAPQEKIDAIRARVMDAWRSRLERAEHVRDCAARKLAAIGERVPS